jgi:hypothetical protein
MDRRQFVMLSGATAALTQVRHVELLGAQRPQTDPVLSQIVAEMQTALDAFNTPIPRAEVARRLATQMRIAATYLQTKNIDTSIRDLVRRHGSERLLDRILDPATQNRNEAERRKRFPNHAHHDAHVSREAMRKWLQHLGDGTVTTTDMIRRGADLLEGAAPRMARRELGGLRPVQGFGTGPQFCAMWAQMQEIYGALMGVVCAFAFIVTVAGAEMCALVTAMYYAAKLGAWADGC